MNLGSYLLGTHQLGQNSFVVLVPGWDVLVMTDPFCVVEKVPKQKDRSLNQRTIIILTNK